MTRPWSKILALILTSNLIIFTVVSALFNLAIPRHFKNDAAETLNNQIKYINNIQSGDIQAKYMPTYLSGNISYMYLNDESDDDNSDDSDDDENTQDKDYLKDYQEIISIEKEEIHNFCSENILDNEDCYYFTTDNGFYILMMFQQDNIIDDIDENTIVDIPETLIMYINIRPFIQYAYSWNWVLLLLFVGVSAIMSLIGLRLSKQIEKSQDSERCFFQNSSHELKTPLMAIQGYAESIQSGIGDPVSSASIIMQESDRMAKLVEELLYISKIDAHEMIMHKNIVDIREVLYDCLRITEPIAVTRNITITPDFISQPVRLNCDEEQLTRAFSNVIVNGLYHCRSIVNVSCNMQSGSAVIKISNDGDGIPEDALPHIFERFYTGHKGGSGIGLSLAAEIVHLHKGTIKVYNNDTGVVFEIKLPVSH